MAVKWSWAFGAETALQMQDDMGWTVSSTSAGSITTSTADVYTYAASPAGLRYSLRTLHLQTVKTPGAPFINKGVITAAIRSASSGSTYWKPYPILKVYGTTSSNSIEIRPAGTDTPTTLCTLYVNGVASGTTFTMAFDTWYYVALVYDMSTTTWSGALYVDGAIEIPAFTQSGLVVQTAGYYESGGFCYAGGGGLQGLTGQLVLYDNLDAAGLALAVAPIFCSRAAPNDDGPEVGAWVPSAGADNYAVTNSNPLLLTSYTEETTPPSSGDNLITEVDNLTTQLGIPVGATVLGVTAHTYSTGAGNTAFAGIEGGGSFIDGTAVTLTSDTKYATATAVLSLAPANTINCRYKIT